MSNKALAFYMAAGVVVLLMLVAASINSRWDRLARERVASGKFATCMFQQAKAGNMEEWEASAICKQESAQ